MGKLKVYINQDVCVGSGQCVLTAPDVFDQREADGIVTLLTDEPHDSLNVEVKKAEQLCPALAIRVEES